MELIIEACNEAAQRDPIVRQATAAAIKERGERLKEMRLEASYTITNIVQKKLALEIAIKEAVQEIRNKFILQLQAEVEAEIQKEIQDGSYRPLTAAQEADEIVLAAKTADHRRTLYSKHRSRLADMMPGGFTVPQPNDPHNAAPADQTAIDNAMRGKSSFFRDDF